MHFRLRWIQITTQENLVTKHALLSSPVDFCNKASEIISGIGICSLASLAVPKHLELLSVLNLLLILILFLYSDILNDR